MEIEYPTLDIFRCIKSTLNRKICNGNLQQNGNALKCISCGFEYTQVKGAVIFRDHQKDDNWFEKMYEGRNRNNELESNYLKIERDMVGKFASEYNLQGPSLEIGCGVGLFAELVPKFIGLEYSLESLMLPGFEKFTRVCGDASCLPFHDSTLELVFSFNTLEHVPHLDLAFTEIDRVLKHGGYILLKPAWHCTKYNSELIPILPYRQLSVRQKVIKFLLPILKTKFFKFSTKIPWRIWRRIIRSKNQSLRWEKLTPYHGELWQYCADSDAVASIDSHETILFYLNRGYECLSHRTVSNQLLAGHDIVILRKF
jgi:SAM-dependent methyltransferase